MEELLHNALRDHRRWRTAQTVFMVFVTLTLAGLLVANYQLQTKNGELLDKNTELLGELNESTEIVNTNTNQKIDRLATRIDCLAAFFSERDRDALVLSDIDQCVIDRINEATPSAMRPAPSSTPSQPTTSPQVSPPPQSSPTPSPNPPAPPPSPVQGILDFLGGLL